MLRTPVMLRPKMVSALVMCVGLMGQFFYGVVSRHFCKLGVSRVASHGLCLVGCNDVLDYALGEAYVTLVDGLNHGHSVHGLHLNVGESAAYTILLSEEGDFFALRGSDDLPIW
jgi:hypothetical protein